MITEELMKPGRWDVRLIPETPAAARAACLPYGHVIVTPVRLLPIEGYSDANILQAAIYTGIVQASDDPYHLGGLGLLAWIGDGDGKGDVLTTQQAFSGSTLSTVIGALLPAGRAIEVDTVNTSGLSTVTGTWQYVTVREALEDACRQAGAEYRVNPDGTLDAATPANLWVQATPQVVVTRESGGLDATLRGLDVVALQSAWSGEEWTSQVVALGRGEGEAVTVGTANIGSNPYVDLHGNAARQSRLVDASEAPTDAAAAAVAASVLNLWSTVRSKLEISSDTHSVPTLLRPGDSIYVYDPVAGIIDTANQIVFRGQVMAPQVLRVFGYSWPLQRGMGIYYRAGNGVYTDLTEYVEWEDGQPVVYDVGTPKLPLQGGGYQPNRQTAERAARGAWTTFTPTFDSGVTLGDGGFGVCRYRVYEGAGGELQMDLQGSFTLGSTSAITGGVIMQVPGGYKGPPTPGPTSQQGTGMLYNDSSALGPWHGAWGLAANSTQFVFRRLDGAGFAALSATSPFTWANGDSIRWDIGGLYVVPV